MGLIYNLQIITAKKTHSDHSPQKEFRETDGVPLHRASSPNEFSWYFIFADGNFISLLCYNLCLEMRWWLRILFSQTKGTGPGYAQAAINMKSRGNPFPISLVGTQMISNITITSQWTQ